MSPGHWIASGGGIGHARFIPGAIAALIAMVTGGIVLWISPPSLIFLAITASLLGIWAVHATGETSDQRWIVVDEFAGSWIALLGLNRFSVTGVLGAFLIFLLLNFFKPGPVGWADRKDGAISVMADDIVAGLLTAAILFLIQLLPMGLLSDWVPVEALP